MDAQSNPNAWPRGDGAMAARIRAHDWAATPLGSIETWPPSLRTIVDLLLAGGFPMVALWGPDLVQIYNDGYRSLMGAKHPAGLGQPTRACRPEVWHINAPIYERVLAGESLVFEDALYPITRSGELEDAWFTLSYSPLRDESGGIAGVLVTVVGTTVHKQIEIALRESEEEYRALFTVMDQGFCVIEKVETAPNEPNDFRYVTANPAFERHTGMRDVVGKTIRELVPGAEPTIMDLYDEVVRTGRHLRFEDYVSALDLWMEAEVFPAQRPGQIAVLFSNVSQRKRAELALRESEERQAFLLKLSDALRPLGDPVAIQEAAARFLGEHLGADRAYYVELDEVRQVATVEQEYRRGEAPSLIGQHAFAAYGATLELLRAGGAVIFDDVETDSRIRPADLPAYRALGLRAFLNTPLIKDGELVSAMCVVSAAPRHWAAAEIALVEATAERTWAAVERTRAESALRESEVRYRTLFESIDQGFCIVEVLFTPEGKPADYRFLEVNPAFERQTGLYGAEGRTMRGLAPEHEQHWYEIYGRVALTGESARFENRAAALDGRWYEVFAFRIGEPGWRRVAILFNDVTERKRKDDALRESEERLRFFSEASSDVIWMRDAETLQWEYLSPAFEAIYGVPVSEALSGDNLRSWAELILPEDRDAALTFIARVRTGERIAFEYRIRRPDGEVRRLRNTDFPVRDDTGQVRHVGGIGRDITAEKENEEALRRSEEQLRLILESARDYAILSLGEDRRILTWNRGAERILGWTEREAIGRSADMIFTPEDRAAGQPDKEQATARTQGSAQDERWHLRRDGSRFWSSGILFQLRDGGRAYGYVKILRDMTDAKRAEERMKELNESLEQRVRERTKQVRSLASALALAEQRERRRIAQLLHDDLQQALVGAQMQVQMLRMDLRSEPPEQVDALAGHVAEIIDSAIQTTRLLTVELSPPVLSGEGLAAALRWVAGQMEKTYGLRVSVESTADGYPKSEDMRVFLFQIARELLFNVVKHAGVHEARVSIAVADGALTLSVEDEGTGFDPAAAEQEGRSGFGLVSVRERVELFGGAVEIHSRFQQGTRVTIRVPLGRVGGG